MPTFFRGLLLLFNIAVDNMYHVVSRINRDDVQCILMYAKIMDVPVSSPCYFIILYCVINALLYPLYTQMNQVAVWMTLTSLTPEILTC